MPGTASSRCLRAAPIGKRLRLADGFEPLLSSLSGHVQSPPQINLASKVIAALRTLETGQFFSASPAMRANAASSRFGTFARNVRADRLMRNPWPSGSSVTAASVVSSVGVKPPACSPNASAMVKHPACAAAINSSGLVPFSFSKRVRNEYGVSASTPESVERVPLPARPVPCQTAFALRIMVRLLAVACSKFSRVSSCEIDRSDQVDRNVDVAACGFRVGANLVRFVHQGLGDVALDTGQADVEASAEEVAAVRQIQVH